MGVGRENAVKVKLLQRWKQVEDMEGSQESDGNDEEDYKRLKETWFSDAFAFLHRLPKEEHCWCGNKDVMLPLLEPFYNLPQDLSPDSSLRKLWQRVAVELGKCTRCVVQHHKAKEFYKAEYLEDVVGPLLVILQELDEERVASHLKQLMKLVETRSFDSDSHSMQVICVMFEVLMFPALLEDAEVNESFRPFLHYVEATHDLTLAKGQHYPGVYVLLLHADQGVRRIATSLAKSLEKFKDAQDMECISPLMQKVMHSLEYDFFDSATTSAGQGHLTAGFKGSSLLGTLRPRVGFTCDALWLGLPLILSHLDPPALEEGVVERYPVFVSIVLNHVSEATSVFWSALRCLQIFLEVLGYKLWLLTTFSAGVVRNTLISQCFHSNQERMHKSIFELFQPFLQSLEALQDKEYKRQRRRLVYFLLQQVPGSKNFNALMSKKARQIAFSLISRGYTMDPPLPPLDCAHVWGPPLVATLKDTGLHQSLRLPAIELFQIILVADSSALAVISGKFDGPDSPWRYLLDSGLTDQDDKGTADHDHAGDAKDWESYKKVSGSVTEDIENWSCVPLLWLEVLEEALPFNFPASFCKAILWALARVAIVDPLTGPAPGDILVSHAGVEYTVEISKALKWAKPTGYDDQSDSDSCTNAVSAQQHCLELVSTFKRCADGFMGRLQQSKIFEYWSWEPSFAEPLLLLLISSNSTWRELDRQILGHFAKDASLELGLELLCSSYISTKAVGRGMLHASKTLLKWPLPKCSRPLNQVLFLGWKLLTLGQRASEDIAHSLASVNISSSQDGGFLKEPMLKRHLSVHSERSVALSTCRMDESAWWNLCGKVSCFLWPLLAKTITDGRNLVEDGRQELTFTRVLQLLPLVCKHITSSLRTQLFGVSNTRFTNMTDNFGNSKWFQDLVVVGSIASKSVFRWWKDAIYTIIEDLARSGYIVSAVMKDTIIKLLQPGSPLNDDQRSKLEPLVDSLLKGNSGLDGSNSVYTWPGQQRPVASIDMRHDAAPSEDRQDDVIDLDSDEDVSPTDVDALRVPDDTPTDFLGGLKLQDEGKEEDEEDEEVEGDTLEEDIDAVPLTSLFPKLQPTLKKGVPRRPSVRRGRSKVTTLDRFLCKDPKPGTQRSRSKKPSAMKPFGSRGYWPSSVVTVPGGSKDTSKLHVLRGEHRVSSEVGAEQGDQHKELEKSLDRRPCLANPNKPRIVMPSKVALQKKPPVLIEENDPVLQELVMDDEEDHLTKALNRARKPLAPFFRDPNVPARRQIVTLQMPGEQTKAGGLVRPTPVRAPPPRMDEWFRRILSMDYFLVSGVGDTLPESDAEDLLVKVPTRFESTQKYIKVFQPLLLEEFKAQLQRSNGELSLSDGMTCGVLRLMSLERVDDFQIGRFMAEGGQDGAARACTENDLLLLTRHPLRVGEPQNCHMLAKVFTSLSPFGNMSICRQQEFIGVASHPITVLIPKLWSSSIAVVYDSSVRVFLIRISGFNIQLEDNVQVDRKERENRGNATIVLLKLCMPTGNARLVNAKRLLIDRSKWHITRLMSLTPQLREFQALSAVGNLPLQQTILCMNSFERDSTGKAPLDSSGLRALPVPLQSRLKFEYNESQVTAIAAAVGKGGSSAKDHQLALVQGPPGTGKTRTIVGIVSALLAGGPKFLDASEKVHQSVPIEQVGTLPRRSRMQESAAVARAWQDAALAREIGSSKENQLVGVSRETDCGGPHKHRVLVCAQSNAAVDELVARMCKDGLYGATGSFFRPFLVRVGNVKTVHPESMPVFIDTLVEERLGTEKQSEADLMENTTQQQAAVLRTKLEEVIESIQVLEALRAQRNRGETSDDEPEGHTENSASKKAQQVNATDKDILQSEAAKQAARVIQEGESAVHAKLNTLYRQRRALSSELANSAKEEKKLREAGRSKRQAIRKAIIREADIVVTTLSGCGGDVYAACMETFMAKRKTRGPSDDGFFSAVVIDEAGQALEPATLIPLQLLTQTHARCVMVGDPKQLPATVLSQVASKMAYECSLFERLQRAGYPVTMLSTQYRMHPEIRQFPSAHFYDNQLTDGDSLTEGSRTLPFHKDWCFAPYVFFDVMEGCQRTAASQSLYNEAEADAALSVYLALQHRYPKEVKSRGFGVITPYKQQLKVLQDRFSRSLGSGPSSEIEFNTVDGFQGREVDILILSTVRAPGQNGKGNTDGPRGSIGFVADVRRMNVALTRARFSLWIVGNAATLQGSSHWAALLFNARERQLLYSVKKPYGFCGEPPVHTTHQSPKIKAEASRSIHDHVVDAKGGKTLDVAEVHPERSSHDNDSRIGGARDERASQEHTRNRSTNRHIVKAPENSCEEDRRRRRRREEERERCRDKERNRRTNFTDFPRDYEHKDIKEYCGSGMNSLYRDQESQRRRDNSYKRDGQLIEEQNRGRDEGKDKVEKGDSSKLSNRDGQSGARDQDQPSAPHRESVTGRNNGQVDGQVLQRDNGIDRVEGRDHVRGVDVDSNNGEKKLPIGDSHRNNSKRRDDWPPEGSKRHREEGDKVNQGRRMDNVSTSEQGDRANEGHNQQHRRLTEEQFRGGHQASHVVQEKDQSSRINVGTERKEIRPPDRLEIHSAFPGLPEKIETGNSSENYRNLGLENPRASLKGARGGCVGGRVSGFQKPSRSPREANPRISPNKTSFGCVGGPSELNSPQTSSRDTNVGNPDVNVHRRRADHRPDNVSACNGQMEADRQYRVSRGVELASQRQVPVSGSSNGHRPGSCKKRPAPSGAPLTNNSPRIYPSARLESEWERFEQTLRDQQKVESSRPQRHSDRPPPFKRQKESESGAAQGSSKPSTVDDILSGLGSLSRSQVRGSKEPDLPSNIFPGARLP